MRKTDFSLYTAIRKDGVNPGKKKARIVTTVPEGRSRALAFGIGNSGGGSSAFDILGLGDYAGYGTSSTSGSDVTGFLSDSGGVPFYVTTYADSHKSSDLTDDELNANISEADAASRDAGGGSGASASAASAAPQFAMPWDPRLGRANSVFVTGADGMAVLYPFASNTIATCYQDMVFHIPKKIGDFIEAAWAKGYSADAEYSNSLQASQDASSGGDGTTQTNETATQMPSETAQKNQEIIESLWGTFKESMSQDDIDGWQREHPYGDELYVNNPDMMGAQSLMNPYSVTRLVGAFDNGTWEEDENGQYYYVQAGRNHLYDIRDSRRFYDVNLNTINPNHVNNPTTTNIIQMSNSDVWGRTPYTFQDFVFCKWWNIIPNNRLITLRKYPSPVTDNMNFPGMKPINDDGYNELITQGKSGIYTSTSGSAAKTETFAPIVTLVGYMGDETGNKISDFLSFSAGVNWEEISSKMHDVTGEEGSDPREVIDNWSSKGKGFFAEGGLLDYGNGLLTQLTSAGGFITSKLVGVNKFVSMFTPGGFRDVSQASLSKLKAAQMDPQADGPYNNRIEGPLNRIDKVWKRKEGITFSHALKVKFDYIARPIGGLNTKAVMLDIMANCLMMGASDAVFWGGGHRFNIEYANHYCYSGFNEGNDFMMKLYNGKIFGPNGAIAAALTGIKNIGTGAYGGGDGTGSFSFGNVTSLLGGVLKSALGGLGSVLKSAVSAVFGSGSISNAVSGAVDTVNGVAGVSAEEVNRGKSWIDSIKNNLEGLWSSKMLQATTFPKISGFKAILTGEPVGPWHLTVGNPLNPMMVIGNLICKSVKISFGNELGPDDFPLEMTATYDLEHGMIRDKAGIESMFNRGSGKIYKLPDYVNSTSDFETKVDKYTGGTDFRKPHFANTPSSEIYAMAGASGGYSIKNWNNAHQSQLSSDQTTVISKFIPHDATAAPANAANYSRNGYGVTSYIGTYNLIPVARANMLQRKSAQ